MPQNALYCAPASRSSLRRKARSPSGQSLPPTIDRKVDGTLDELLARYVQAAIEHAEKDAPTCRVNRAAEVIAVVYAELRKRGPQAQNALLVLLDHPNAAVRAWAGAHALDFAPEQGEPVLVALSEQEEGLIGFNAEMTLDVWRAGELRFP